VSIVVAKVGGSLFDLPDLADRLRQWLAGLRDRSIVLVPGGGAGADVVRRLDEIHRLGDESAHWLALGVARVNAQFLAGLLDMPLISTPLDASAHAVSVLDPYEFCRLDEGPPGALPHTWDVTTDSIAARVAAVACGSLVLLKSTDLPPRTTWQDAAANGLVDRAFPNLVAATGVNVSWLNLRRL
jgi:5-(aminomethyl)-3-furanmethanol phosphate kinase